MLYLRKHSICVQQLQKCHGIEIVRELVVQNENIYWDKCWLSHICPDISPTNRLENLNPAPNIKGFIVESKLCHIPLGTDHFRKLYTRV